jgi:hypothetical protein
MTGSDFQLLEPQRLAKGGDRAANPFSRKGLVCHRPDMRAG